MTPFHAMRLVALAGLTPLAATPLLAQSDNYFYGGASVGRSRASLDDERMAASLAGAGVTVGGLSRDRTHTGYKLFGGYQFNRHLGVELGGFQLGRFGFDATTQPVGTLHGDYRVRGLNIDLVGTLPLFDRLSALGRVGAVRTRTRSSFDSTGAVRLVEPDRSRADTGYKLGLGLQYAFSPALLMRGEVERYRVSDPLGGNGHVNLLSVSLVIPFGRGSAPAPRAAAPAYMPPAPLAMTPPPPAAVPAPIPPPVVVAAAPAAPPPVAAPAPPPRTRVTYSAASLFGFDRSTLQPEGKAALDGLLRDVDGATYSLVEVEGHTDRIGTEVYNQQLSLQRAQAVGDYLASSGRIDAAKITIVGKGESMPVTLKGACKGDTPSAELVICLQPDRRVEIGIVGTR